MGDLDLINRGGAVKALIANIDDVAEAFIQLEKLPAVDAVPVVRCGDCRFCTSLGNSLICDVHTGFDNFYVTTEFYCADGERRERWTNDD